MYASSKKFYFILSVLSIFYLVYISLFKYLKDFDISKVFGLNSYRATHWIVNYYDLSFIKRGLIGTIIKFFNLDKLIDYNLILFLSLIVILFFITITIFLYSVVNNYNFIKLIFISFLFSHTFIYFYFLDLGRFDQINNILLIVSIFLIIKFNNFYSLYFIFLIIVVGTLIHEAFLLIQYPMIFFVFCYKEIKTNFIRYNYFFKKLAIIMAAGLISALIIAIFGYPKSSNPIRMQEILSISSNFELNIGVLETFFYNPLKDLFVGFDSFFCIDKMLCRPFTLITLIFNNIPFIVISILFLYRVKNDNKNIYDLLFFISIFIPLIVEIFITFVDYYRVDATLMLNLFIFILIYLRYNENIIIHDINTKNLKVYGILSIGFNFVIITSHLLFNNFSSSVSPFNFLLFELIK